MVGSDKERPKGRVGSGSDNARGSPILTFDSPDFFPVKAKISSNQPEVLDRKLPRPDKIICFFHIDKIGSYQCQCADGYSGEFCQTKIPYCSTPEFSPCQNGGKCIDHFTHYTCECKLGFAGENCTTNINDCVDHMCQVCIFFCFKIGLTKVRIEYCEVVFS